MTREGNPFMCFGITKIFRKIHFNLHRLYNDARTDKFLKYKSGLSPLEGPYSTISLVKVGKLRVLSKNDHERQYRFHYFPAPRQKKHTPSIFRPGVVPAGGMKLPLVTQPICLPSLWISCVPRIPRSTISNPIRFL